MLNDEKVLGFSVNYEMIGIKLRVAEQSDELKAEWLAQLINQVYKVSEGNIWVDDYQRTSKEQLFELIRTNQLLLAIHQHKIIGCVWVEKVNNTTYKFKMLVTDPEYKGKGVGTLLVSYAEEEAIRRGAYKMQLELLVPTEFEHPDKIFLTQWYTRIGYQKVAEHEVDYVHQGISRYLKTGCVAQVFEKQLV